MKRLFIFIILIFIVTGMTKIAGAESTYATSVYDYDAYFMNWDSTDGFYHNEVDEYPDAGADLDWLLGEVDESVAAGWGGDANGGTLTLYYETAFASDGTVGTADIIVYGFGYAYNTPFSSEKGAMTVYASSDGENWTVISDYVGYNDEDEWEANPDFTESNPGVPSTIMSIDLDDGISNTYSGGISYLKFELGDGETGHGRAFFTSSVEGVTAYQNNAPVADAGVDQTVDEGEQVTLDGTGSTDPDDGDTLTYEWEQTDSTGYDVDLSDSSSATPTFTAPDVSSGGAELIFRVTVTDNGGLTDTDQVSVNINFVNQAPVANAGPDQTVDEGEQVTLDGTGSADPDDGDTLTYKWEQTDSTGNEVELSDTSSATPKFTAPDVSSGGAMLTFQLTVTDNGGLTSNDDITVAVASSNNLPVADAGVDQTVDEGEQVTLDGTGSSDPDDGDTLTYKWEQTDSTGYDVDLSGSSSASPTFTAPDVSSGGAELAFQLTVTDNWGLTDTDQVTVNINFVNQAPVADAGADQRVDEGTTVTLNGTGSSDPDDGDTLTYKWEQTDSTGYDVDLSDSSSAIPKFIAPDVSSGGAVLTFRLTVTDNGGLTDADQVTVNINFVNQAPVADAGANQNVDEGTTVTLDGTGSSDPDDGDTLTYKWEQTDSTGYDVDLSDSSSAAPTFTAPDVDGTSIILEFSLTVTDSEGDADSDSVTVTVKDSEGDGSVFATAVADYGASPAPVPEEGIFMNWDSEDGFYHNEVSEYPDAGADLSWALGPVDETIAAGWGGDANGGYWTFEFDEPFSSDGTDSVDIAVHGFGYAYNTPFSSEKGAINVYASANGVDWTLISEYAGYDNGDVWEANPDFTESAPGVPSTIMSIDLDDEISSQYTGTISCLKFVLGDGTEGMGRAFFINAVQGGQINVVPTADAGVDQEVSPGDTVTLDASGSNDLDDGIVSYQWKQVDPTDSTEVFLDDSTSVYPVFTAPDAPGETLTFELTVTDKAGQTDTDSVEITIESVFDIKEYYGITVEDESGCISWNTQDPDDGENALGLPDYVPDSEGDCSGWEDGSGYLVVGFKSPLEDRDDRDDLAVAHFGTGQPEILVSSDGQSWTSLGTVPAGSDGGDCLTYDSFDFSDIGVTSVQYVKIIKTGTMQCFIDSLFIPVEVYGAFAEDTDSEYPDGTVDWVAKQADDGVNSLGEPDYDDSTAGEGNCSGWMVEDGRLTIGFDKPFFDGQGDDLNIYHFGRGGADVEVSVEGLEWMSLGELPAGINGGSRLDTAGYDFGDYGISSVQYVRINKTQVGYTYGRFIDAVEGLYGIPGALGAAGRDQTVEEGVPVTLGSDEEDDEGETVSYEWEQTEGPVVVLSAEDEKNPQFIAPMIDSQEEDLCFSVARTDSTGTTEDEVMIHVVDNGMQLTSSQELLFSDAEYVFNNEVGADNNDESTCYMGLSCEGGNLISYEAQDPDSTLSSDYIDDFDGRPKNIIYGLLSFDVKVSMAGDMAAITIYLPEPAPDEYEWYKYSDELGWFNFSRDTISGGEGDGAEFNEDRTIIYIYITDGGIYDDDGMADGYVTDPSGLADATTVDNWHDEGGGSCFINTLIQP